MTHLELRLAAEDSSVFVGFRWRGLKRPLECKGSKAAGFEETSTTTTFGFLFVLYFEYTVSFLIC